MAANLEEDETASAMEIIIRRVGMEDHINIVKLFQVSIKKPSNRKSMHETHL